MGRRGGEQRVHLMHVCWHMHPIIGESRGQAVVPLLLLPDSRGRGAATADAGSCIIMVIIECLHLCQQQQKT